MTLADRVAMALEARDVTPEPVSTGQAIGMPVSDRILAEVVSRDPASSEFSAEVWGALGR